MSDHVDFYCHTFGDRALFAAGDHGMWKLVEMIADRLDTANVELTMYFPPNVCLFRFVSVFVDIVAQPSRTNVKKDIARIKAVAYV